MSVSIKTFWDEDEDYISSLASWKHGQIPVIASSGVSFGVWSMEFGDALRPTVAVSPLVAWPNHLPHFRVYFEAFPKTRINQWGEFPCQDLRNHSQQRSATCHRVIVLAFKLASLQAKNSC